jgi:hypothetical protein
MNPLFVCAGLVVAGLALVRADLRRRRRELPTLAYSPPVDRPRRLHWYAALVESAGKG